MQWKTLYLSCKILIATLNRNCLDYIQTMTRSDDQ